MNLEPRARTRLLLLGLGLLLTCGLIGGAFELHQMRLRAQYAQDRADGLAAAKAGDNATATMLLAAYLNHFDPNDVQVLVAYAQAMPKTQLPNGGQIRLAIEALHRLLSLDPHRPEQWRELMELYHDRPDLSAEANQAADNLLAQVPGDAEALQVKAGALLTLNQYNDALTAAQTCLAAYPRDWITQFNRISILSKLGRSPQELVDTALQATQGASDDPGAMLVRARAYELAGDSTNMDLSLRAAAALPCNDRTLGLVLVSQLDFRRMYAESESVLQSLARGGDPKLRQLLLRRLWESNRSADVSALCDSDSQGFLKEPELQGMEADALHRIGKDSQAHSVLENLKALSASDVMAAAWWAIDRAQSDGADDNAGDYQNVRSACQAAARQFPRDPYLLYFQAKANAVLGEDDAAIDLWTQSAKLSRTWAAPLIAQAQTLLSLGRQDDAATSAAAALACDPSSTSAAITQAMVWFAAVESGSADAADKLTSLIDQVQQHDPGEEQTLRMRVAMLARDGQTAKAADTLRAMLTQSPPISANTLAGLIDISRQWHLGTEDACIAALRDRHDQTPGAVLAAALDEADHQQAANGLATIQAAIDSAPPNQIVGFRLAMANYLEKTKDKSATAYWVHLGDQLPDDLAVQQAALASEAAYQDRDFYSRTIDRVHQLLGDDAMTWQIARARWLLDGPVDSKATADAIAILEPAVERVPDSLPAHVLLAMAKSRAGDLVAATEQYTIAQRLNPDSPTIALELAHVLQARGDFYAAHQQLDTATKDQTDPQRQTQAALLLAEQGDYKRAISILEPITDAASPRAQKLALASMYAHVRDFDHAAALSEQLLEQPDATSLVLAAQIDVARGEPQAAERALARLKDVQPWPPGALERTLGQFRESQNQLEEAATLYRAAVQAAPGEVSSWLDLMNCQAALGKPADLQATLNDALAHLPNDQQLTALKAQSDLMPYCGSDWTGRQLLLALVNDPSPTGPAVTTLSVLREIATTDSSDILPQLGKVANDLPRFLPAQMLLTDAQMRLGRTDEAIASVTKAVQAFPTQPRPAELAVMCLANSQRWDEALQMAQTWRDRIVGDPSPADLEIATLQLRHGDNADALATLQPYLNATGLDNRQKWQIVLTQAMALLQQGQSDQAAQAVWPMAQNDPALWRSWAAFIIDLPPAQAEQWLNRLAATPRSRPEDSAQAQLILSSAWDSLAHKTGQARYDTMARDLLHQVEQDPAAAPQGYLYEGILDEESGDRAGAKAAYTQAAAAKLPEAENNLASLLTATGGDLNQAADLARQCVQSDPNQPVFYDTLADVLSGLQKYDDAIDAMHHAIRLEPGNPKWHVNLAKILLAAGRFDEAKQTISELDLMSPGVSALPPAYQQRLDDLRKQLANAPAAVSQTQ